MADLEAQAEGNSHSSQARNIPIPKDKLEKLVKMLARSVKILQSTLEARNTAAPEEMGMETIDRAARHSNSVSEALDMEMPANSQGPNVDHFTPRITLISQEELEKKKAQRLEDFERSYLPLPMTIAIIDVLWCATVVPFL